MPWARTSPDSRNIGAGAVRKIGRSACQITCGNTRAMSPRLTVSSWWVVPSRALISRWNSPSSYSASAKRSEKVWKPSPLAARPSVAISELSRPPER